MARRHRQAITYCREALRLFGDLQRPRGVAMSLFRLGSAERRSGEYEDAMAHLTMSFEAFAALGEAGGTDMARYGLGLIALAQAMRESRLLTWRYVSLTFARAAIWADALRR